LSKQLSIEEIITGCRNGQAHCQRALVHNYSELLYSICLRYTGDETKSKDVLQESFIRIFRFFKSYDSNKGSLTAWMRKITVNVALRSLSKKSLEVSTLTVDFNNRVAVQPEVMARFGKEDLMKVVMTLPDGYRQVFNLSVIEGYSHKEIAEMLGIKEVSSRSNLSRAKQLLRKKLNASKNSDQWIKTS